MGLLIWMIGFLFTAGLTLDDAKDWDAAACVAMIFIGWPLFLGGFIRDYLKDGKLPI